MRCDLALGVGESAIPTSPERCPPQPSTLALPRRMVRRVRRPSGAAAVPVPSLVARNCLPAPAEGGVPGATGLLCSSPENRFHPSPRCLSGSSLAAPCQGTGVATGRPFDTRSRNAPPTDAASAGPADTPQTWTDWTWPSGQQDASPSTRERIVRRTPRGSESAAVQPISLDARLPFRIAMDGGAQPVQFRFPVASRLRQPVMMEHCLKLSRQSLLL